MAKRWLIGAVLGTMLSAVIISGCAVGKGPDDGRESDRATLSQGISEREGGDSRGEHGSRGVRARNPVEKPVKAAVNTAPAKMAAVQVLMAVERAEKPLCRAQSSLSDSRGTVSSADWLFPCSTMQQPVLSMERCKTRSH